MRHEHRNISSALLKWATLFKLITGGVFLIEVNKKLWSPFLSFLFITFLPFHSLSKKETYKLIIWHARTDYGLNAWNFDKITSGQPCINGEDCRVNLNYLKYKLPENLYIYPQERIFPSYPFVLLRSQLQT